MLRPGKVATPFLAVTLVLPFRMPSPGSSPTLTVIGLLLPLTGTPVLLTMLTVGAGLMGAPATAFAGCLQNTRWFAATGVTLKLAEETVLLTPSRTAIARTVSLVESASGPPYIGEPAEGVLPSVV